MFSVSADFVAHVSSCGGSTVAVVAVFNCAHGVAAVVVNVVSIVTESFNGGGMESQAISANFVANIWNVGNRRVRFAFETEFNDTSGAATIAVDEVSVITLFFISQFHSISTDFCTNAFMVIVSSSTLISFLNVTSR